MHIFSEIHVSAYCIRFGACKIQKRLPRQDQEDPATVDFRLLALHASRGCAEIAGLGFEPRTLPSSAADAVLPDHLAKPALPGLGAQMTD